MKATKALPSDYISSCEVDLSRNVKLLLLLNLLGIGLFLLFGWLFFQFSIMLRKSFTLVGSPPISPPSSLATILGILAAFALVLIMHEGVHGLFFWIITRDLPNFGFRGAFAYAAAPGWFIERNSYLIVGLAPLMLISLAGMLAIPLCPAGALLPLLFGLTINAAGAVGDLYIVGWLLGQPADALVNDRGDAITVYLKAMRLGSR